MELDRPHLRTSSITNNNANNSELFICFASSRLSSSSSSMKIAKSFLSPGRAAARDTPVSLSNSLSRRLRAANGSIKGGQASPMFPSIGRKKGCHFENPEPSSPKVTCIGQVRVKTKKKANQTRSLSRRRSAEVSFRKAEHTHDFVYEDRLSGRNSRHIQECLPERNQRWVHFPVTICEALRAFGAEFSCLFPCRSPCFSTKEKGEKSKRNEQNQNSCGAVFARWFVSLQDSEGREARQIELVVGGEEERTTEVVERRRSMRSSRRHMFEDIEFSEETIELKAEGEEAEEEEEKGRVSICIPPKNALLLMRCRSDPKKMAALTNRFWESPAPPKDEEEEDGEEITKENVKEVAALEEISHITNETKKAVDEENEVSQHFVSCEDEKGSENVEKDAILVVEVEDIADEKSHYNEESHQGLMETGEVPAAISLPFEVHASHEVAENIVHEAVEENGEHESCSPSRHSFSSRKSEDKPAQKIETETEKLGPDASSQAAALEELQENEAKTEDSNLEEKIQDPMLQDEEEKLTTTGLESQEDDSEIGDKDKENDWQESTITKREDEESQKFQENYERSFSETSIFEKERSTTPSQPPANVLPDCLLLMMCEPKLSMDMSKETWVCSADFIRWLPERPVKKVNDKVKKRKGTEVSNPSQPAAQDSKAQKKRQQQQVMQPPRSSCSLPAAAAASMATMIEQKLVNAVGYEPFVLTRCKSEPMRTAAAKLVPEACCWKNRKVEPHRRAALGVGAAGLGF